MEIISKSPEETKALARKICLDLIERPGPVIIELVGDLGAGKTTFMKGVGEFLGIKEEIISPTFLIQRNYTIPISIKNFKQLVHLDAYRIEKVSELDTIGWEKYSKDPNNLIFVEWPENLQTNISGAVRIEFFHQEESTRKIILKNV